MLGNSRSKQFWIIILNPIKWPLAQNHTSSSIFLPNVKLRLSSPQFHSPLSSFLSLTTRWHTCIINSANWIASNELLWCSFPARSHCMSTFGDRRTVLTLRWWETPRLSLHVSLIDSSVRHQVTVPPSSPTVEKQNKKQKAKTQVSVGGGDADTTETKSTSANSYCLRWRSSREGTSLTGECTGCKRKPQRHLLMLCDIIWLVKWRICTLIARECSNHTEVITASTQRCFSAHSPHMQGLPRQSGESSGPPVSGKYRTVLDLLLCLRTLGRSHSVSNAVSHPSV